MSVIQIDPKIFSHDAQGSGFKPTTHVDLGIDFKRFIVPEGNSYILEGIRGTGKTHILKMVISEIEKDFQKYKIIPALVTVAGAPEISKKEAKYFRVYLYTSIIRSVCNFIKNKKEIIVGEQSKVRITEKIKKLFLINNSEQNIESNINKLLDIANQIIQDLYDNPDRIVQKLNNYEAIKIGAGLSTSMAKLSAEESETRSDEQIKEYTTFKLSDIYGLDVLLSFLKLVKQLLDLNYVYLLLDECSESNKMMQTEVFRLCKQIRAYCSNSDSLSKPDVCFIIAVYPPQNTKYPSTTRGDDFNFQPGHDCSPEYLEIDELNDEFESFFSQLLENRLKLNIKGYQNVLDVFENHEAATIAAYCSGGVPRRFLEIIKQAYNQLSRDFGNQKTEAPRKIDSPYILSAVGQVVESPSLLNDSTLGEPDKIVLEKIFKKFVQRNKAIETKNKDIIEEEKTPITIYFTTAAKSADELGNLISIGIIHDKKRSRSRKSSIAAWQGAGILCSIDIGVAIHRGGVISRNPSRILDICRQDIKKAAHRGFTYTLDVRLEEESLEFELEQTKEFIHILEKRLLDIDKSYLEKTISDENYTAMIDRVKNFLDSANKSKEKIEKKLELRKIHG